MNKVTQWIKSNSSCIRHKVYTMNHGIPIPFEPTYFIYSLMHEHEGIDEIIVTTGEYNLFLRINMVFFTIEVYDNISHISLLNSEVDHDSSIKKCEIEKWLKSNTLLDQDLYEFINTKMCVYDGDQQIENTIEEKNIKLVLQNIDKLSQPNVLIDGYELFNINLERKLPFVVNNLSTTTIQLTLESINYRSCISAIDHYLVTREKYLFGIRQILNKTLFLHSYVVVVNNLQWDFQIFESDKNIVIDILATVDLVPNDDYYRGIGYYLTELDHICMVDDQISELKLFAEKVGYAGDCITIEKLREYIFSLKYADVDLLK